MLREFYKRSMQFHFGDLITISLDIVWILLGENWCWSPLGLKGLIWLTKEMLVSFIFYCQVVGSKLCVLDTDDVKQKTSLFSVQGRISLVLFHGFCSFVLCHLCPVRKVNASCTRIGFYCWITLFCIIGAVYLAVQGGFTVKPGQAYPPKFH